MNSLRALSSRASRCCISLKVLASWPTSSLPSSGIGVEKSPSATFSAAASSRRSRFACARAASQPAASASRQRDHPGDQDLAPDQRDVVVHLAERRRQHRHPARPSAAEQRNRRLARALAGDLLDAGTDVGRWPPPPRRPGSSGRIAVRSSSESPTTNSGCGPAGPERTPSSVTRASVRWATLRTRRRSSLCDAPRRIAPRQPAALVGARLLEPLQLLGGQARAQLRHDVEVDEADRRRGDHEERAPRGDCGRCQVPLSVRHYRGSDSRRRAP